MAVRYRFLFDECLTKSLPDVAHSLGYEATHALFLDRAGASDRLLAAWAVERDYVMVTNNRADFVRIYERLELHPGLIVILPNVTADRQRRLFARVVAALPGLGDLVNKRLEIDVDGRIEIGDWPPPRRNEPNR